MEGAAEGDAGGWNRSLLSPRGPLLSRRRRQQWRSLVREHVGNTKGWTVDHKPPASASMRALRKSEDERWFLPDSTLPADTAPAIPGVLAELGVAATRAGAGTTMKQ